MSTAAYQEAPAGLAGHDLVTVVAVELEKPWRPKSPLDIPRMPRPIGGVPIRRRTLAEVIEHNSEAMKTRVRHWWVVTELMAEQPELGHGRRATAASNPGAAAVSSDAETGDNGSRRGTEYSDAESRVASCSPADLDAERGDGRGDRGGLGSTAGDSRDAAGVCTNIIAISGSAMELLGQVAAELSLALFDRAERIATARAGNNARVNSEDVLQAAVMLAAVTPRSKGGDGDER